MKNFFKEKILFELGITRGSDDNPAPRSGCKWNDAEISMILRMYVQNKKLDTIAKRVGRTPHAVASKLAKIAGFENPYEHDERKLEEAKAAAIIWKEKYLPGWIEGLAKEKEDRRLKREERKAKIASGEIVPRKRDVSTKIPAFLPSGTKVAHPLWGDLTVVSDNEIVTVYLTSDGKRKRVKK